MSMTPKRREELDIAFNTAAYWDCYGIGTEMGTRYLASNQNKYDIAGFDNSFTAAELATLHPLLPVLLDDVLAEKYASFLGLQLRFALTCIEGQDFIIPPEAFSPRPKDAVDEINKIALANSHGVYNIAYMHSVDDQLLIRYQFYLFKQSSSGITYPGEPMQVWRALSHSWLDDFNCMWREKLELAAQLGLSHHAACLNLLQPDRVVTELLTPTDDLELG